MESADHLVILDLMTRYFDGLYRADSAKLRAVFHDDLSYVNATGGNFIARNLDGYMADIDRRTPPDKSGDQRNPKILQVQCAGDEIIFVLASMTMMDRDYLDALTLIKTTDGWKIISKVFSFTAIGEAACHM